MEFVFVGIADFLPCCHSSEVFGPSTPVLFLMIFLIYQVVGF